MASLSRRRILEILGEVDDHTIARIIDTGASESDLRQAVLEMERETRAGESTSRSRRHSEALDRLYEILARIAAEDDASRESAYD